MCSISPPWQKIVLAAHPPLIICSITRLQFYSQLHTSCFPTDQSLFCPWPFELFVTIKTTRKDRLHRKIYSSCNQVRETDTAQGMMDSLCPRPESKPACLEHGEHSGEWQKPHRGNGVYRSG